MYFPTLLSKNHVSVRAVEFYRDLPCRINAIISMIFTFRDDSHNRVTRRVRSITREKRLSLAPPAPHYLSCQKSKHIEEPKISERLSVFFVVELQKICQMYYDRVYLCEGQKWDLEREVRKRDYEVQEK